MYARQDLTCVANATLLAFEPGNARGRSQLPRQRPLLAGLIERRGEQLFSLIHGIWKRGLQEQLAFDAQQLGSAPALLVGCGARERLVDDLDSLTDAFGFRQA